MHTLRIAPDWERQIDAIRNAHTEDTNLIRFDNAFHRICRDGGGRFSISLLAGSAPGRRGLQLDLQERDLYVTHVGGQAFGRYASTLDHLAPQAMSLDQAVLALPGLRGTERFEQQSLIVFCVAESLRSDRVAVAVGQTIRATMGSLRGVPPRLPLATLLPHARAWGQTSEAILAALSLEARNIVLRPRVSLTPLQRRFSERVDLNRVDPAVREHARLVKVLKRPG